MIRFDPKQVIFINPRTCGIYKNGGIRYKVDPITGTRTDTVDNEMADHVQQFLSHSGLPEGAVSVDKEAVRARDILVPRYYDSRYQTDFWALCDKLGTRSVTLGRLEDLGILTVHGGHGSPGNDQRIGEVPYIKVSDIRNLRINVNPTNLIPMPLAQRYWRGPHSNVNAWDLVTPNRASSNIGEFAIILPGEEQIVLTKEVFILRFTEQAGPYSPFYLLWALCLQPVRLQWQRVTLMQTNREDVNNRYREIEVPLPPSDKWAREAEDPFRDYFNNIATARTELIHRLQESNLDYIASARRVGSADVGEVEDPTTNTTS